MNYKVYSRGVGMINTNCYLLVNEDTSEVVIFDPGAEAMVISEIIIKKCWKPAGIILTHGHFDHILAADSLRKEFGVKIYANELERPLLESAELNQSTQVGLNCRVDDVEYLKDGAVIKLADFELKMIATPGHTGGSACFYNELNELLFSGDTLFYRTYGRTDLPTGSLSALRRSINDVLFKLPDEVRVYPGHGSETSIGEERIENPIVN